MPAGIPVCPEKPKPTRGADHSYRISLITPMFGGGVETQKNDPDLPVRATAIRGQLEFWWRATVGAQYAEMGKLRKAQSEVWGNTEHASPVQVLVEGVETNRPTPCAQYAPDRNGKLRLKWREPFSNSELAYALFPFQGEQDKGHVRVPPSSCLDKVEFRLVLRLRPANRLSPDALWRDVEPAVWAWANFGGLGSRTRRGCGAVFCSEIAPRDREHFVEQLKGFVPGRPAGREWPTIGRSVLAGRSSNPIDAWKSVIGLLHDFRQMIGFARNSGRQPNRPGRSRFPEPESIRRATNNRCPRHARLPHVPDDAFPRAELGLPIVFHFKDEKQGDPPDTVLYPSNGPDGKPRERMASPLILKPLALAEGTSALPLVLLLNTVPLDDVDLRAGQKSLSLPQPTLLRARALASYSNSPLAGSANGSALEAFIAFARERGFQEVSW